MNNLLANANNLPQPINSFVANTANTINNTIANASNTIANAGNTIANTAYNAGNVIKNVGNNMAVPVMNSVNAIPSSGPSMPLIAGISILLIILVLFAYFGRRIQAGVHKFIQKIKALIGAGEADISSAASTIGGDIGSISGVVGQEISSDINKLMSVNKFVPGRKEVFNISENRYKFNDAEPLCKAFGAELATYEQVQKAWSSGADWCNYGWVKGQAAVYPTQKSSWDKLQQGTDDERMQCGQVGVNGGYFDNPELRFGVNCYGEKPPESEHDMEVIMKGNNPPLTPDALAEKKKELKFRAESGQIGILPFRQGAWSS